MDGIPQANEVELIADHVFSFQVALGFDGAPADGDVVDLGTTTDEWYFSVPSDPKPASIRDDQLRMVGIGIVVGGRASAHAGEQASVFDGPLVSEPGIYLAATQSRVAIRNLNIAVP